METREIKFRGQCAISKEMVFGDLIHGVSHKAGNLYILPNKHNLAYVKHCDPLDGVRVIPETVGQFTGLTDKNGKKIYEGDIVNFHYFYGGGGIDGFVECEHELTGTVCWGIFGWALDAIKGEHWKGYTGYNEGEGHSSFIQLCYMNESGIHEESFEIIGNIHEHPNLLTPNN